MADKSVVVEHKGKLLVLAAAAAITFLFQQEDSTTPKGPSVVYADKLARGIPTACGGLTNAVSPYPVVVGEIWSAEKCQEATQLVMVKLQKQILKCLTVPVSQNTLAALTSHGHNFGWPSTCGSQSVKLINAGKLVEGCDALAVDAESGKKVWSFVWSGKYDAEGKKIYVYVEGLQKRRLREAALCKKPDAK